MHMHIHIHIPTPTPTPTTTPTPTPAHTHIHIHIEKSSLTIIGSGKKTFVVRAKIQRIHKTTVGLQHKQQCIAIHIPESCGRVVGARC